MSAFTVAEYHARLARAQTMMADAGLAALLLTTEPAIRYFTGFLTRFWESPTRPWFLIVPASGAPVAVIPAIGAALMGRTWVEDIRTWRSPDPEDEGVSLLATTLREVVGRSGRIGVPSGPETHLRMPLDDYHRLVRAVAPLELAGDGGILRHLRLIKSEAEIARISRACAIAGAAFARLDEVAREGVALDRVFRDFQRLCLEEGADWVPYLAGAAGPDGYEDVISPADPRPLTRGDVLMLDTGLVHGGYFCDFDRNAAVGSPSAAAASAHARLLDAVEAGLAAARPGATAADVFHAMAPLCGKGQAGGGVAGEGDGSVGRLGHGLGMQLTEPPSLTAADHTVLAEGMVLTLEPAVATAPGRMMVHEENIVIRSDGAELLSPRATALTVL